MSKQVKKELVILVDEQDTQVGLEEKLKAHELGLLHRAFSVFLFRKKDGEIQVLLQQRAKNKYHCGGLWANTCCSHPREAEDIVQAGKRRIKEELNIDIDNLKEVDFFTYRAAFPNKLIEHEVDHVLIGALDLGNSDAIDFNKNEVEAICWVSLDDFTKKFTQKTDVCVPWALKAFNIIPQDEIENLFK